jgi:hypothetical protein
MNLGPQCQVARFGLALLGGCAQRLLRIEFRGTRRFISGRCARDRPKDRAVIRAKQISVFNVKRTDWTGLHLFLPIEPTGNVDRFRMFNNWNF